MSADPGAALERIARAQQARRRKFYLRDEKITMSHGSGGKATHNLIEGVFAEADGLFELVDDGVGPVAV